MSNHDARRESKAPGTSDHEERPDAATPPLEPKQRAVQALWVGHGGDAGPAVAELEAVGFCVRETAGIHDLLESGCCPEVVFVEHTEDDRWLRAWRATRAAGGDALGVLVARSQPEAALLRTALHERLVDVVVAGDMVEMRIIAARLRRRVREAREQARRLSRLRRRCSRLEASRRELLRQVDGLAGGVASAYESMARGMKLNSMATQFETILRQDLDLESVLRMTLEYALKKVGSTNGAIFLPDSCGDFTLGAYVNFDLPRDTAETLSSQLADTLAPACDGHRQPFAVSRASDLGVTSITKDHWLGDHAIVVQACWQDNECIAVIAYFRDAKHPFSQDVLPTINLIADTFGRQLARVVRTHHRHKPKEQFGDGGGLMAA
ncbi:MAG: GAF domain-containing protein [Phycisphaerae bacterium]